MNKKKSKVTTSPFVGFCPHCYMMLTESDLRKPGYKCPSCGKYATTDTMLEKHPDSVGAVIQ